VSAPDAGKVVVASADSVVLRGVTVALDTDVGQLFVTDCARNTEDLLSDSDIKRKWGLSDEDWQRLADNAALLHAVRAECERRISSGECAREAARLHFTNAPNILNSILTDEQIAPRHRIEAARELPQVIDSGPDAAAASGEKFTITIIIGEDYKLVSEVTPRHPSPSDDGERP
jgi:hypothetical protein